MKILLAENDIEVPETTDWQYLDLVENLKKMDGDFATADIKVTRNGNETVVALTEFEFDYIVLDLMMLSGEDPPRRFKNVSSIEIGYEILVSLLENEFEKNRQCPIAVMTGNPDLEVLEKLRNTAETHKDRVTLHFKPVYFYEITESWNL